VVSTLPEPAIGKDTPGAEKFPGGFEGGTTIKVETAGKKRYHQFATGMGNLDWSENHLDYWVSDDGKNFQRKDVLRHQYVNKETGKTHQSLHPYPFFSEAENRWHMIFMEYVVEKQWDTTMSPKQWVPVLHASDRWHVQNMGEFEAADGFKIQNDLGKPLIEGWPNPDIIRI
jgi:hypothetical protein